MPIYEYKCEDCGKKFELIRSIKDADLPTYCKCCQSAQTHRAVSAFFAQSGSKIIAGGNVGCAGCSSGSCASCNNN